MGINAKIAAISYLNTIPFLYGIRHEGSLCAELLLAPPSQNVIHFIEGKVDLALIPAAVVPTLKDAQVITDYCIGAVGAVRTVMIVSNTPIECVERIWLDAHSRTSVQLAGYLAKYRWKISPQWLAMEQYTMLDNPQPGDAFLIIGDKCFGYEGRFAYNYDLASEWIAQTHLPFTFALWVARKGLSYQVHDALQRCLTYGVEHTYEAILESEYATKDYAYDYLTRNIDYLFDSQKHKALQKFWDFGLKIEPKVNPG